MALVCDYHQPLDQAWRATMVEFRLIVRRMHGEPPPRPAKPDELARALIEKGVKV